MKRNQIRKWDVTKTDHFYLIWSKQYTNDKISFVQITAKKERKLKGATGGEITKEMISKELVYS